MATLWTEMDPRAVEVCLPWALEERGGEDAVISTSAPSASFHRWPSSIPSLPFFSLSLLLETNGIMLNPRRGKFATRRRDVYPPLRAVSPSREKSCTMTASCSRRRRRRFDPDRWERFHSEGIGSCGSSIRIVESKRRRPPFHNALACKYLNRAFSGMDRSRATPRCTAWAQFLNERAAADPSRVIIFTTRIFFHLFLQCYAFLLPVLQFFSEQMLRDFSYDYSKSIKISYDILCE